jgi:cytoskeletal protein CcmA (bactofilin family)
MKKTKKQPVKHQTEDSLIESEITLISESTRIEGQAHFSGTTRFFGTLKGQIQCEKGSQLILMETAVVEGSLDVDTLIVAGFVRGEIRAHSRVLIEGSGRVIGNIHAPSIQIDFGAFVEGEVQMPNPTTTNLPNLPV